MLVLTRKKNDSIVIDGRIVVEVLQIKGNGIRLGITAPDDVSILRGELKPFGVASPSEERAMQASAEQTLLRKVAENIESLDPEVGAQVRREIEVDSTSSSNSDRGPSNCSSSPGRRNRSTHMSDDIASGVEGLSQPNPQSCSARPQASLRRFSRPIDRDLPKTVNRVPVATLARERLLGRTSTTNGLRDWKLD